MANIKFNKDEGVWRTIGGRRVFIRTGKSLPQAMKESGKFKKKTGQETSNSNPRDIVKYYLEKGEFNKADEYIKEYGLEDERDSFLENLNYKVRADYKKHNQEYELYKKAKERPNEIDPMTENSTDWEALDRKYKEYYKKENKYNDSKEDFHFAGEELYSEDPNRFGDKLRKINDKMNSPLDSSLKGLNKIDSIAGDDEKLQTLGRKIGANSLVRYRNAWEEYRKEHPNSKISLYQFIKMNEE